MLCQTQLSSRNRLPAHRSIRLDGEAAQSKIFAYVQKFPIPIREFRWITPLSCTHELSCWSWPEEQFSVREQISLPTTSRGNIRISGRQTRMSSSERACRTGEGEARPLISMNGRRLRSVRRAPYNLSLNFRCRSDIIEKWECDGGFCSRRDEHTIFDGTRHHGTRRSITAPINSCFRFSQFSELGLLQEMSRPPYCNRRHLGSHQKRTWASRTSDRQRSLLVPREVEPAVLEEP